jgi:hypothetical protein
MWRATSGAHDVVIKEMPIMFPAQISQQLIVDRRARLLGEADALRQIRGISRTRRGHWLRRR